MTGLYRGVDAIVHFGAGRGGDLAVYVRNGAVRVIMVEADPEKMPKLQRAIKAINHGECAIEIVEAAVLDSAQDVELSVYNLDRVNSIRPPSDLAGRYPGLKVLRKVKLRTRAAIDIVNDLKLDPDQDNKLIIDTPDVGLTILENLSSKRGLSLFSRIRVNASAEAFEAESEKREELEYILHAAGFLIVSENVTGDRGVLNAVAWNPALYRNRLEELNTELDRKEVARKAHEENVVKLSTENVNLQADKEKLDHKNKKQEEQIEALEIALDAKKMFDVELSRCEAQLDLLKHLLTENRQ